MPEGTIVKVVREQLHDTVITGSVAEGFHQVHCETAGCLAQSPEFDGRRYLAENWVIEHNRAVTGWTE